MNQLLLNKNELPLLREMLTKYKQGYISGLIPGSNITFTPSGCRNKIISSTGGGAGGGIQSIQEGDNITVDNTDPLNPIISATDSSSALFPNGFEFISTSRDFQAGDAGKLLIINDGVLLSMPETNPFTTSTTFGVLSANIDIASFNLGFEQDYIKQLDAEVTILQAFVGLDVLSIVSSGVSDDKTALRYLYDKVNARIYEAIISQTGTDAPTVVYTVKDDLNGDITFTRTDVGDYRVNSSAGLFFVEKASMQIGYYGTTYRNHISTYYEANDNYSWFLKTYDDTGTLADNAMTHITIKITVYSA